VDGAASIGVVALTAGIFAILVLGVQRRDIATTVNAGVSIVAVVLPLSLQSGLVTLSGQPVGIEPALPLWVGAAGFLHSLGMVGLYERLWWWDHLTHTLSAAFVAALLYASLVVVPRSSVLDFSLGATAIVAVLFTFWVGVFWELVELIARDIEKRFGIEPILVHYGWRDTVYDLGFDIVGATLVVIFDFRIFVPITRQSPASAETFLLGVLSITTIGSVVMALVVTAQRVR
jgi:hypothetical protein